MTTVDNGNLAKTSTFFHCILCDYNTKRKYNFNLHLDSIRHKNNENNGNLAKTSNMYKCNNCEKEYKDRAGLWRHNKKCQVKINTNHPIQNDTLIKTTDPTDKELIMLLIKENSELKSMMMKVIENGTHNTTNNNINTNSHNKAFNLNFFLNETCKNAMNITDFVDSIKLQLSDLMDVGELGYVDGISKIIVKNLNNLDETIRPIHCTDKKRETFYVKDQNQWEKEDDNKTRLKKAVKMIANKNIRLLPQYRAKFPDYNDSDSIHSDEHSKIVIESMACDKEKDDKIIRNISNVTTIHKL
jgi:hypothetical protein